MSWRGDGDTKLRRKLGSTTVESGSRGSKVLAATVVGTGVNTITMSVSHEAEFDSRLIVHHWVIGAADGKRIHAFEFSSLRFLSFRANVLASALVG